MTSPEPEQLNPSNKPELLIVLGKNIGVCSTPEDMRQKPRHLSQESRMNVLAAGELWTPETDIVFSSGQTAGSTVPSEAEAMKNYLMMRYPSIPTRQLLKEDKSIDTAGNAQEIAKLLQQREKPYKRLGLVTVGYHLGNAAKLFENFGVRLDDRYAAEDVVSSIHPVLGRYVNLWSASDRIAAERRKENLRALIMPVDRRGKLLRQITRRWRK